MTLTGLPTATALSGMSWVTTAPAPITTLLPMVTPISTVALPPIHTLLPMTIRLVHTISFLPFFRVKCVVDRIETAIVSDYFCEFSNFLPRISRNPVKLA